MKSMKSGLILALVRYLTNRVVARIPIYAVRHAWYRKVLGMSERRPRHGRPQDGPLPLAPAA